ncbi:hypothetical protein PG994_002464 [Apiospora phragmitis]|uniref:Uncharacterized protein n=1 Tax=Apiospora phragmitis TaxID=2905665 RepID=A0ABR1WWE3_9PEZI
MMAFEDSKAGQETRDGAGSRLSVRGKNPSEVVDWADLDDESSSSESGDEEYYRPGSSASDSSSSSGEWEDIDEEDEEMVDAAAAAAAAHEVEEVTVVRDFRSVSYSYTFTIEAGP